MRILLLLLDDIVPRVCDEKLFRNTTTRIAVFRLPRPPPQSFMSFSLYFMNNNNNNFTINIYVFSKGIINNYYIQRNSQFT